MNLVALQGAIELGLIYALTALGIFVSYRILDLADLTVDGSFTLGAGVSAVMAASGHPVLGVLLAILAGAIAGLCTAFLQTKLRIQPILAGILTMTGLYSINFFVMGGRPNVPLLNTPTIFTAFDSLLPFQLGRMLLALLITLAVMALLALFLHTQVGLSVRATGDNPDMVRSSSINVSVTKSIGLAIANAIVALSGALIAQYQAFADLSMGIGMVVIALASLIIGEVIFGKRSIVWHILAVGGGAILYRIIIMLVLQANINPTYLKLLSSIIVVLAISVPVVKDKIQLMRTKQKRGVHHAANR